MARRVEAVWSFRADAPGDARVLPDGRCDVLIRWDVGRDPVPVITGPATAAFDVAFDTGDSWVGLRLRPGAGRWLWQGPPPVDAALRGPEAVARLPALSTVLCQPDLSKMATSLGQLAATWDIPPVPAVLDAMFDAQHVAGGRLTVSDLAALADVSERHVSRLFRDWVGLPPKTYAQLVRMHRAVSLLRQQAAAPAVIAQEAGFADQAHMLRHVKRFSGHAPSRLPDDLTQPGIFA
ncbi:MAG: helix-turn-helix transcriptional regulator [Pseudomonadota bacterium]